MIWITGAFRGACSGRLYYPLVVADWTAHYLKGVLDSLDVVVISVTPDGTLAFLNARAAQSLGLDAGEAVGKSLYDHFPGSPAAVRGRIQQTLTHRSPQHFVTSVTFDDEERQFDTVYTPAFDDRGEVSTIQIMARDVTDQDGGTSQLWKFTSDNLSMTKQRIEAILVNAPLIIAVLDADMTIRYINRGRPGRDIDNDVIGRPALQWLMEEHRSVLTSAFEEVVATQKVVEFEFQGVSEQYWFTRFAPLIHDGEVKQVLACTLDVTERTRLTTQLATKRRVESLGIMARGIAHDFNNLLAAIMNGTALVRQEVKDDGDVGSFLDTISAASRRAADLCEQMLTYAGREVVPVEPCQVNPALEELMPVTRAASKGNVELILELGEDLPAAMVHRSQLGQVIMNLVNNAADAFGEGRGHVRVSTGTTDVESPLSDYLPEPPSPGHYVRIEVTDDAGGLSPEERLRIFDPFYSTKTSGHGLGLAVVLGIVAAHRGAISVHSVKGKGTTMTVLLPASAPP